ncbi:MAG: 5-deoxy-glucuronate isomerase [Ktedonobacterales bacterium]|nr:5-deoxy-glucuronate isomerase [Ktedonobacterales bacterium]
MAVQLTYHYDAAPGLTQLVTPGVQPLNDLDFAMLRLGPGEKYTAETGDYEVGVVLLAGTATLRSGAQSVADLGERTSVFAGRASGVYLPIHAAYTITAGAAGIEAAICRCRATEAHPMQVVRPPQVVAREAGQGAFRRYVHDILGVTNSQAQRLIVGETFTPAGNWSSFPPHKHDTLELPDEVQQEELYIFKIRPEIGFGIQGWYTRNGSTYAALNAAEIVHQNDVTIMPYGYHPVAAPPGYDVYYLWFMAGPVREMHPHDDPDHTWIKNDAAAPRDLPR